jgi:ADP-ribose pyrophosphatase YjhB (NUDIX family)
MKEQAAGGVIIRQGKVVVVEQMGKKEKYSGIPSYSLPKGHIDEGEDVLTACYREIYEETGLKKEDLELVKKLEAYTRPDGNTGVPKDIHMFLFKSKKKELHPIDKENPAAQWIDINKVADKLTFKEDKEFFLRNMEIFINQR